MKNYKELLKTCDGLEKLPKKALENGAFQMLHWRAGNLAVTKPKKEECSCGFAGCFIGWNPVFNPKSKLKLKMDTDCMGITTRAPAYKGRWGYGAIAEYFGITREDAEYLLSIFSYNLKSIGEGASDDPKPVIKRIRAFVAKKLKAKKKQKTK